MNLNAEEAQGLNRVLKTLWRPSVAGGEALPDAEECDACSQILTAFLQSVLDAGEWCWSGDGRLLEVLPTVDEGEA